MKRSWLVLVAVFVLGGLAGIAIAGRPSKVDDTVITPAPTTTPITAALTTPVTTATTAPAALEPSSTTTVAPLLDRTAVRVLVANATSRAGIAGSTADVLVAAGFAAARAVDAINGLAVTVVFARAGFEEAAQAVAQELGLAATVVQPMPDAAVTPADAEADVIVAIGDDFPV